MQENVIVPYTIIGILLPKAATGYTEELSINKLVDTFVITSLKKKKKYIFARTAYNSIIITLLSSVPRHQKLFRIISLLLLRKCINKLTVSTYVSNMTLWNKSKFCHYTITFHEDSSESKCLRVVD